MPRLAKFGRRLLTWPILAVLLTLWVVGVVLIAVIGFVVVFIARLLHLADLRFSRWHDPPRDAGQSTDAYVGCRSSGADRRRPVAARRA
jgi:hypothetical protein